MKYKYHMQRVKDIKIIHPKVNEQTITVQEVTLACDHIYWVELGKQIREEHDCAQCAELDPDGYVLKET